ncbi:MAG: amino acid ABC transporter ATP-binding protein [Clostridia bacterium]|nr:amino acid ABC transporter ATP-binding protein [Clostridia bacterium]
MLKVEDLHKSFGTNHVLKGISFSLEKGAVLSIIGSSGNGKTTLLRCLNFLEIPDSGRIYVKNELIFDGGRKEKIKESEISRNRLHFGLVFQSFNLFPQYNVLKNITLAQELMAKRMIKENGFYAEKQYDTLERAKEYIKSRSLELLDRVGLLSKEKEYPYQLSGGQQQRVAIARALAMQPDILCFDEPTSALDPELTGEVLKVIKELKDSDCTMIIVTHEIKFAHDVSDRIIFMADGTIEEEGTPEQVIDSPAKERTKAFLAGFGS